jgi:hypothetical protein
MLPDKPASAAPGAPAMNRRSFLRTSAVVTSGLALAASLSPLRELEDFPSLDQFLQKVLQNWLKMSQSAEANRRRSGKAIRPAAHVRDLEPMDGRVHVCAQPYALHRLSQVCPRLRGNNLSRNPEIQYIRVLVASWFAGHRKPNTITRLSPCRRRVTSTCRCNASNAKIHPA